MNLPIVHTVGACGSHFAEPHIIQVRDASGLDALAAFADLGRPLFGRLPVPHVQQGIEFANQ